MKNPLVESRFSPGRAVRRDSAVHVSLSSYSPVKQPGTGRSHPSEGRRVLKRIAVEACGFRSGSEPGHRISMRSFEDAPSRRGGGVPKGKIYASESGKVNT